MRKLCSLLMSLAILFNMALPVGAAWTSGDSISLTENHESASLLGVHYISNAIDFANIAADPSGTYYLANDIDLSEAGEWTPLDIFSGILDGQGYSITGVKETNRSRSGLFLTVTGTIRNLHADVDFTQSQGSQRWMHGGLASNLDGGTLENCYVTGKIISDSNPAGRVGALAGNCSNATIKNCYSTARLELGGYSSSIHDYGRICRMGYDSSNSTFENCYFAGTFYTYTKQGTTISGISSTGTGSIPSGVTSCYFLETDKVAGGTTQFLMKLQSTYVGWDFDTVWAIDPQLK